jgi:sensor c-di-GMP phosphodiesterase-like protein
VDEPGRLVVPPAGQVHIVPPVHTLQGGESIIVDYRVRDGVGVNVLINPELIAEVLDFFAAGDDGIVMLKLMDGRALTPLASAPPSTVVIPAQAESGFFHASGGFIAVAEAERYPVQAVVTASYGWLRHRWWSISRWPMLAALLASLVAVAYARRTGRAEDSLRESLTEAIEAHQLVLHYQPVVDLRDGRWLGAEALVRWRHPERGLVLPDEFITCAEDTGLIHPLTEWVLRQVRADLRQISEVSPDIDISVNLSKQNLESELLVEAIDATFPNGEMLGRVLFEITERSLISEGLERAKALVERLAAHGARFALDDFGTGYSGLSYLRHFKLSYVKIDGSFVRAIDTEAVTANIVDGVIALARSLNLELVAEGVETEHQATMLRDKGLRLAQGFHYSQPLPLGEFLEQLRRRGAEARLPVPGGVPA